MNRMKDFPYKDVIHRCFRCGYCKFPPNWADVNNCPPYARFRIESYSCGGRLWLIRSYLSGEISYSEHFGEILYACTSCKNCEMKCPLRFNSEIVNMIVSGRSLLVEEGKIPERTKKFFTNVELFGNPYGMSRKKRTL